MPEVHRKLSTELYNIIFDVASYGWLEDCILYLDFEALHGNSSVE